jgi:hypothetical protein
LLRKISAIRVQCFIRQFLSRCRLKHKVIHLALVLKSAAIITTFFRIIKAKKKVRELKELKWNNYLTYSATKIQVQWRGFEAKGKWQLRHLSWIDNDRWDTMDSFLCHL